MVEDKGPTTVEIGVNGRPKPQINKLMRAFNATSRMEPAIGFGSSSRPPLLNTGDNPGPGSYLIKTLLLGKVPDSRIRTTPQYSLRGREKFGSNNLKAIDPTTINEPGPGHYEQKIVNPNEFNAPKFSFPKGHFPRDKKMMQPGPGAYKLKGAVGVQVLSTRRSENGLLFGRGNRPPLMQVSTSELVGPGEYGCGVPACEKQLDSRKRTNQGTTFGRAERDPYKPSVLDVAPPGPGCYKLPSGMCGRGSAHPFRAAPAVTMSGREKFGSPFGW